MGSSTSSTSAKTAGEKPQDNSTTVDVLQQLPFLYKHGPVPPGSSDGDSSSVAATLEPPLPPNKPPMGVLGLDHTTSSAMLGTSLLADL